MRWDGFFKTGLMGLLAFIASSTVYNGKTRAEIKTHSQYHTGELKKREAWMAQMDVFKNEIQISIALINQKISTGRKFNEKLD